MNMRRYLDRNQAILEMAQGRKVLHLGCVGFSNLGTGDRVQQAQKTLHWKLSEVAEVVGVDYSESVVQEYKKLGIFSNILVGNVERLEELGMHDRFELIVAGDIIEHISNPGQMLEGIKRNCLPNTQVVITMPNAFGLPNYLRFALGRFAEGAEHVTTFNAFNIKNLLERHGYEIQQIQTCHHAFARKNKLFALGRVFFHLFPKFGGTLFVVASPGFPCPSHA